MPGTQIKVFDKIIQVIEMLAISPQGVTLKKVQQALGLNKATAFRILRTIESHRVAARNEDGAFSLGSRVLWWGARYQQNYTLSKLVRPHLERLRNATSETAVFSIMSGDHTVVVDQALSPHATSTRFDIGFSAPLHAGATGRVMLAHLDPEIREKFLNRRLGRFTEQTIIDRRRIEQELKRYLVKGFAFSEGERLSDTSSLAAPVFGLDKEILGVISLNGPSARMTRSRRQSIAVQLLRETRLLTRRLNKV